MPSVLRASFEKYGPVTGLEKITVRQKYGNHTLAFLDYQIRSKAKYVMPASGTPMTSTWGTSPLGARVFYGYVNHFESVTEGSLASVNTRLVALGTSQVLNSSNPTSWTSLSRSGIAREIAKRNNLRSIVHEHPDVLDSWANGTKSDFLTLNALAEECGFRTWVDGSTVYFLDPKKMLTSAQSMFVPTFTRAQVYEARVTGGSGAPRDDGSPARRRVLHGLDEMTNEFFTASGGNPNLPVETVGSPATNYSDANLLAGSAGQYDTDYYTLKARVRGNAEVTPGTIIHMPGNPVNGDLEGYWLVQEATHVVTRQNFETSLVATRGVQGKPVVRESSTLLSVREQVPAVIRSGRRWEAMIQEHVNV